MNEIVFLTPNTKEPFTTSDVIAECTGIRKDKVKNQIEKYMEQMKSFGKVEKVFTPCEVKTNKGGRPQNDYKLNEQQATFLMTLLKNTPVVVQFKQRLVKEFFRMRQELQNVSIAKSELKPLRLEMTDAIKALPDSPHKGFKYGQYTDLAYLMVIGKTARTIRKERGAKKDAVASDYMTSAELEAIADTVNRIAVLVQAGYEYAEVKNALKRSRIKAIA